MGSSTVRFYSIAVTCNVLALIILFRGLILPLSRQLQLMVILLTAISLLCWLMYFRTLKK